jgi:hypothetical protein
MTILDFITLAATGGGALREFLVSAGNASPEIKPKADEWIAKLDAAIAPENLAALGTAVIGELGNISQGKLDPREHPSDAI